MLSLSWQGHRAAPACCRHCRCLSILQPHPASRLASPTPSPDPVPHRQLPGKRAQLETVLTLIGITFQVSFSAACFPPHLPIVSILLIATFNSLRPGSPRAAAAVRTWGPSAPSPKRRASLTKGHAGEHPTHHSPVGSHSCSLLTPPASCFGKRAKHFGGPKIPGQTPAATWEHKPAHGWAGRRREVPTAI